MQVWVTGSAMSSSGVSVRLDAARRTKGRDEVARVLEWEEPPDRITFASDSEAPTFEGGEPGPEVRELTEIAEWLDARGIALIFTGSGVGPVDAEDGEIEITWHTANLYEYASDKIIGRFNGQSRLEAARAARNALVEEEAPPGDAKASAPAPEVIVEDELQRDKARQRDIRVIENAPLADDPESAWVIEAYDKDGNFLGIAVQETQSDAWLTIIEDFIQEDET